MSYVLDMRGWFIEIYKGPKKLFMSICVVFKNDVTEIQTGIQKSYFVISEKPITHYHFENIHIDKSFLLN